MDATDIRSKLRTATAANGSLVIIGAEECGSQSLASELEVTDKTMLQDDLNAHAGPLVLAIDRPAGNAGHHGDYSGAHAAGLRDFFAGHLETLEQAVVVAEVNIEKGTRKFHERNGDSFEKGRQKNATQARVLKKLAAMSAVNGCKEVIGILSSDIPLKHQQLVLILEVLKTVILALATASTHFAVVFISDPCGLVVIPVARIFHDQFGNGPCAKLLSLVSKKVVEISKGTVVVRAEVFDGAQRLNRLNTAQAMAAEAIEYTAELSAATTEGAGQASYDRAMRIRALSQFIIITTRSFPPKPPITSGIFHAVKTTTKICMRNVTGDGAGGFGPVTEFQSRVAELNDVFPRPLVKHRPIPMGLLEQRPPGIGSSFIPVSVVLQLATIEQERKRADAFIQAYEVLEAAERDGITPLSKLTVSQLRALLSVYDETALRLKADLISALVARGSLPTADDRLRKLVTIHAAMAHSSYQPRFTVAEMKRFAANAELAKRQAKSLSIGSTSRATGPDGAIQVYDPYHLFHNIMTKVVFGPLDPESLLNREKLLSAAKALGCEVLISIFSGIVDKHAHSASLLALTDPSLVSELRSRGELQTAVVLEVLGRAANAWILPHQTEERRNQDLLMCSILVFRVFGAAMRDVSVLRSAQPVGGILTNQWLDLLSNNEARVEFKQQIPVTSELKETALSTRPIETFFSRICSTVGVKPTQFEIKGLVPKLDALIALMRDDKKGFTIRESSRKRKVPEVSDSGWNDGVDQGDKPLEELRKRAKGYTTGKAPTIRDHNKNAGNVS